MRVGLDMLHHQVLDRGVVVHQVLDVRLVELHLAKDVVRDAVEDGLQHHLREHRVRVDLDVLHHQVLDRGVVVHQVLDVRLVELHRAKDVVWERGPRITPSAR